MKKLHLLSYVVILFCMTICLFPHLFPDFVVYAMTNDTLETVPSNNLPNIGGTTATETSNFPNPMQKSGISLVGDVTYWAVFSFSVVFSACTLYWFHSSISKC